MSKALIQRVLTTDNSLSSLLMRLSAGAISQRMVHRSYSVVSAAAVWKGRRSGWLRLVCSRVT